MINYDDLLKDIILNLKAVCKAVYLNKGDLPQDKEAIIIDELGCEDELCINGGVGKSVASFELSLYASTRAELSRLALNTSLVLNTKTIKKPIRLDKGDITQEEGLHVLTLESEFLL